MDRFWWHLWVNSHGGRDKFITFWAGTGFTLDFWILVGYLNKLWTDIDKILWVDSCGAWTNCLGFELDPDHSPDAGTWFTPDFWISAGYLKKLWTDFDEILFVDSCRGLHDFVRFWAASGSEFGFWNRIYTRFFNFSGISEDIMDRFRWNLMGR